VSQKAKSALATQLGATEWQVTVALADLAARLHATRDGTNSTNKSENYFPEAERLLVAAHERVMAE
jgi:hypothetical protein